MAREVVVADRATAVVNTTHQLSHPCSRVDSTIYKPSTPQHLDHHIDKFDSGFVSGDLQHSTTIAASNTPSAISLSTKKPSTVPKEAVEEVKHNITGTANVQREYNRADSGICERMSEGLRITEPTVMTPDQRQLQQQQQQTELASSLDPAMVLLSGGGSVLEFYDTDEDGDCQLHLAIADANHEVAFVLIRWAPHPAYLDIQNKEMYAPLHIAVLVNQPRLVRRLVICGAATDIRDAEGNTPLHLAAKRGLHACAHALLSPISTDELREAGVHAGPSAANSGRNNTPLHAVLNLKNYNGEHCVHLATIDQHMPFLSFLSGHQADMNATEGRSGKTALHYAVNMGNETLVRMLTLRREQGGCGVALNTRDWAGRTALQCAKINGHQAISAYLASLPGCDTCTDDSDEDFEFDTDEDMVELGGVAAGDYGDLEVNGVRIVESMA